jgi:hypothetical protein
LLILVSCWSLGIGQKIIDGLGALFNFASMLPTAATERKLSPVINPSGIKETGNG